MRLVESQASFRALAFVALILIASFGIHTIETHHHDHGEHHADVELSAYFHGNERKEIVMPSPSFAIIPVTANTICLPRIHECRRVVFRAFDYDHYQEFLSAGIMHPKIYS